MTSSSIPADPGERPSFNAVYTVGLTFLPQALRWLGVVENDLDDMLQDVFLAAYRGLGRYNPQHQGRSRTEADDDPPDAVLRRWLFGIARHQTSHYHERAGHRREIPSGAGPSWSIDPSDPTPTPEQQASAAEQHRIVTALLQKIPASRRIVLIMYDLLGIPIADIALDLKLNENTVRSRLRIARADFRAAITRDAWDRRRALRVLPVSELPSSIAAAVLLQAARRFPQVPAAVRTGLWRRLQERIVDDARRAPPLRAASCP